MLSVLDVSASALRAERIRMDTISQNLANAQSTFEVRGADGSPVPYRRRGVIFQADGLGRGAGGVRVSWVYQDPSEFPKVHQPGPPHAAARGYVRYPNVNIHMEMVDLLEAVRAYEA